MLQNYQARQIRKKQTAEEFTPLPLVNEILDRLSKGSNNNIWQEDKNFIDPACGNGNFLIEVLKRKLNKGHNPLIAISNLYGCDIMLDNINECRLRLIKVLAEYVRKNKLPKPDPITVIKILRVNIKWTPLKKYPNGSLDYNFSFDDEISNERASKILEKIRSKKLLEQVKID